MTEDERNSLLVEMTDAVADEVLYGSYTQTQALSLARSARRSRWSGVHARLIRSLEQEAGLNRELEGLPSEKAMTERRSERRGLLAPELATLLAYCKIYLFEELLDSDLPDDPYLDARPRALLPRPAARTLRSANARAPAAARDHRHGRRQPARRSRRDDVRVPACGGDRSRDLAARARLRRRARGVRDALVLGRRRGARQQDRGWNPARHADRGPAAGRARDALAGAGVSAADRHRGDHRAFPAGRADARRGAPGRARGPRRGGVRAAAG